MALIPCPHCDRHVRDDEVNCPFCDGRLRSRGAGGLTRAAVIAGAALIAPGCSGDKKEVAQPDPDDSVEQVDSVPAETIDPETVDPAPVDAAPVDAAPTPDEVPPPPPPPPPDRDFDNRNKKPYGAPPNRDRAV